MCRETLSLSHRLGEGYQKLIIHIRYIQADKRPVNELFVNINLTLRIDPLRLLAGCRKRRLNQAPLNLRGLI